MARAFETSFLRYVAARKGARAALAREGSLYAYAPEERARSLFARVRPVELAVEASLRQFIADERPRLRNAGTRIDADHFPALARDVDNASRALGIAAPETLVTPDAALHAITPRGSADDPVVVIPAFFLDAFTPPELRAAIGSALGAVANGHVTYLAALAALSGPHTTAWRWAIRPAKFALESWAARARITTDRASLLVARDLDVALAALVKTARAQHTGPTGGEPVDGAAIRIAIEASSSNDTPALAALAATPGLRARARALAAFVRTSYFRGVMGDSGPATSPPLSVEACDAEATRFLAEVA